MWPAVVVWVWAIFTSHLGLRVWMFGTLAALMTARAAVAFYSQRRTRARLFGQSRSAYPSGDNEFNRR